MARPFDGETDPDADSLVPTTVHYESIRARVLRPSALIAGFVSR